MRILLLTPTSDRIIAFRLVERWIHQQTYQGEYHWLIADDGTTPVVPELQQEVIRLRPKSKPITSFRTNIGNLIKQAAASEWDYCFWIEDDVYYKPDYLRTYLDIMQDERIDLLGESFCHSYSLMYGAWQGKGNKHSSLCKTAFSRLGLSVFRRASANKRIKFSIDRNAWLSFKGRKRLLPRSEFHAINVKGMPGKVGFNQHSKPCVKSVIRYNPDRDYRILNEWFGDAAPLYESLSRIVRDEGTLV